MFFNLLTMQPLFVCYDYYMFNNGLFNTKKAPENTSPHVTFISSVATPQLRVRKSVCQNMEYTSPK